MSKRNAAEKDPRGGLTAAGRWALERRDGVRPTNALRAVGKGRKLLERYEAAKKG